MATTLAERLDEVLRSPADGGTVELIVRRPQPDRREIVGEAELDLELGLVGDCWHSRETSRGPADPDAQVTLMNARIAALIAGDDPERWALAGDQLYVDFDLGAESLPAGSRIAVGSAVLEITALPHAGCGKFSARFGSEALRLVNARAHRVRRLRGVNARVVEPGRVRRGDAVRRVAAPAQGPLEFVVDRRDLRRFAFLSAGEPDAIELRRGEVVLRVDRFGFSANNVTYATLGMGMRYWEFFPAPDGWGRIPVWGYADVVRSAHDEIRDGERLFGYLPTSTHVVVQPVQVSAAGFVDGLPHRADLPPVYQRYSRVAADPRYAPELEDQQALWRPLFITSFGAADYLADHGLFGARAVVLSSASSKTALGIAFLLSRGRPSECEVVGLTSPRNVAFCEAVGYYDRVLDYGGVQALPRETPTTFVDLAGDAKLLRELRGHLGGSLRHACIVGATHWEQLEAGQDLAAAGMEFFFLPPWLEKRRAEWGPGEFGRRYGDAWGAFLPSAEDWLRIVRGEGPAAVEAVYREQLEGRVDPAIGHILSLAG